MIKTLSSLCRRTGGMSLKDAGVDATRVLCSSRETNVGTALSRFTDGIVVNFEGLSNTATYHHVSSRPSSRCTVGPRRLAGRAKRTVSRIPELYIPGRCICHPHKAPKSKPWCHPDYKWCRKNATCYPGCSRRVRYKTSKGIVAIQ